MKIVVLTGSPNKNGTSFYLADKFIEGATGAGHAVKRFDAAFMDVNFCQACNYCLSHGNVCVYKDDFVPLRDAMYDCDLIAFVVPVYFFTFPAQFKKVLDRFHAFFRTWRGTDKKMLLITTSADERPSAVEVIKAHYGRIVNYVHWQSAGELFALGVSNREALLKTDYPQKTKELGESLK